MSDVLTHSSAETATRAAGLTISPEEVAGLLVEVEYLRVRVAEITAEQQPSDEAREARRQSSAQLRRIAEQVILLSVLLVDEELRAACANAIRGLAGKIARLRGVCDQDEVAQEAYTRLRAVFWNLGKAPPSPAKWKDYTFTVARNYLRNVAKKARQMEPLAVLPGEEAALPAPPDRAGPGSGLVFEDIEQLLSRVPQGHGGPGWDEVLQVLMKHDYSLKAAAAELGITRRKMKELWEAISSRLRPELDPTR